MCDITCVLSFSHSVSWVSVVLDLSIPDICLLYFNFIEIILNFRISELKHFLRCTFITQFVQSSLSSCVLIRINGHLLGKG